MPPPAAGGSGERSSSAGREGERKAKQRAGSGFVLLGASLGLSAAQRRRALLSETHSHLGASGAFANAWPGVRVG